ncbi:MAG TPA: HAD family acid phosphatase [Kofleriaceae bacterium]
MSAAAAWALHQGARTMRASKLGQLFLLGSLVTACADMGEGEDGAADIQGEEEKADGTTGIEVTARIKPGTVDADLSMRVPRRGYVFYAAEAARVSVETTRTGSSSGLDTVLKVYGPRLADGSYPKTLASDEDGGYGKLSKISELTITIPGFYLIEASFGAAATAADAKKARVKLACTGSCDSALPVDLDLGLKWYRRSAERRALTAQAYSIALDKLQEKVSAGITGAWGVVLDIDETTLNNSTYQQERMDLGLGYSPASWFAWVERKAATPLDGVSDFVHGVKQLGGKVVFVSNRAANECAATQANLTSASLPFDGIFCKTDTSDKNPRFTAIANGTASSSLPALKVILYVGDNILDFPMLSQDLRKQPASAYAKFGQDFILLPNSMYGSWEKNTDDNSL